MNFLPIFIIVCLLILPILGLAIAVYKTHDFGLKWSSLAALVTIGAFILFNVADIYFYPKGGPTSQALAMGFFPLEVILLGSVAWILSWSLITLVQGISLLVKRKTGSKQFLKLGLASILLWSVGHVVLGQLYTQYLVRKAQNQQTSAMELKQLYQAIWQDKLILVSKFDQSMLLEVIMRNPNTPQTLLEDAYHRGNMRTYRYSLDQALAQNPNTPPAILVKLANSEVGIAHEVASNPHTPVDALTQLSQSSDSSIRTALVFNPSTPVEVIKQLASDPNYYNVASPAQERLKNQG